MSWLIIYWQGQAKIWLKSDKNRWFLTLKVRAEMEEGAAAAEMEEETELMEERRRNNITEDNAPLESLWEIWRRTRYNSHEWSKHLVKDHSLRESSTPEQKVKKTKMPTKPVLSTRGGIGEVIKGKRELVVNSKGKSIWKGKLSTFNELLNVLRMLTLFEFCWSFYFLVLCQAEAL